MCRNNTYKCTVLESDRFYSILECQEWVVDVRQEGNDFIIQTIETELHETFKNIIDIVEKFDLHILSIKIYGDLLQVLRRSNNE